MRTTIGTIGAALVLVLVLVAGASPGTAVSSDQQIYVKVDNTGDGYEDVAFRVPGGVKSFIGPADDPLFVDL